MKKSVLVAMSGGVDSSVAAALLVEQGYEVIGITMKLRQHEELSISENGCCSLEAVEDARRVSEILGIPHYVLNFSEEFRDKVIDYFIDQYSRGYTPNPCIACNRHIKFELLLNKAKTMGVDYISTGHYARTEYDPARKRWLLKKSLSAAKDQTYALYNMTQYQLEHTLFPIGQYTDKEKIRSIAAKLGLRVADKPESQDICFIDDDYGSYIQSRCPGKVKSGDIVDTDGNVLGKHRGIVYYTIGQRKGLGLALGKPVYVVAVNPQRNEVIVGGHEKVYSMGLIAKDINLIAVESLEDRLKVTVKIRYAASEAEAFIEPIDGNKVNVIFKKEQRAVTPGQSVVFYTGDVVVGGGIIDAAV